jgi:putative FmdB family regulatory protein
VPIYEYVCESCAFRFERKQSMKEDPVATCERCGKPVTRLISSPALMFKGSGWYVTDYSDKLKPPAGSEATAPPPSEKTDGDKKDSSPSPSSGTTPAPAPASTSSSPASSPSTSSGTSAPTSTPTK